MTCAHVYKAITSISRQLARTGIAKSHVNEADGYLYRSIDDVLNRLSPLLTRHRLCVLPRLIHRTVEERRGDRGQRLMCVAVTAGFDLVSSRDGSTHSIQAVGEAIDASDKATAKAMSAAYKTAMLQTFCVPVAGLDDADASSPLHRHIVHEAEPVEGWTEWTRGIIDMIGICESLEALDRVQNRNRALLLAVSRERAELYQGIGSAFLERRKALALRRGTAPAAVQAAPDHAGDAELATAQDHA